LPPVFGWHDPAPTAARPAEVSRVLLADGWRRVGQWWTKNGKRLTVTLDFEPANETWMEVMEQEQLRRAGIDASLKPFVPAEFNAPNGPLRSGHFTVAASQWIGAADPEQSVVFACSQRGPDGNNDSDYCDPQFEALFEDQATTRSPARRRADFIAMQRIVRRDVPIVPIAFETRIDGIAARVTGFRRNMLMYPVDPQTWDAR